MRSSPGQATPEYVAVVLLVAVALGGLGTAIAAPGVPRAVVREARHALCVVGGDVCRTADAARRGLEPCVVAGNGGSSGRGVTLGFLRLGRTGSDMIERRSDGTLRITRAHGVDVSGTAGLELAAGPVLQLGASGTMGAGYAPGRVWEVDADAFRALVRRAGPGASRDDVFALLPAPVATYHELSPHAGAQFTAALMQGDELGVDLGSTGTSERRELGLRTDRDGTRTYYYAMPDTTFSGLLADLLPTATGGGETVVEWRASAPPELTLRVARPAGPDGAEEYVGHVVLDDPAAQAAARRAVLAGGVVGDGALRAVVARMKTSGTFERLRYAVTRDGGEGDYGVQVGVGLGFDHAREFVVRELVDAEVLGPGGGRRLDCLGA